MVWSGKDLYAKLGLVRDATTQEIDAAYNTLVLRYNNETEPQKYQKLQDAYRVLGDPEEKYYYDLPCMKVFRYSDIQIHIFTYLHIYIFT